MDLLQFVAESKLHAGGIILLAVLLVLLTGFNDPLAKIPGPWYTRWTNLVLIYKGLIGRKPSYVQSLHLKYGPVVRISPREVDFSDPTAAQEIHRIKNLFRKAQWYRDFAPNATHVFNTTDVEIHRRHRRLLSAPLSETGLKAFVPQIDSKVRLAISRMEEEAKARGAADVYKWSLFLATDVIGELSFGESFRMLEHGKVNQYIQELQAIGALGSIRATFPLLTKLAMRSIPLPGFSKVRASAVRIRSYATQSIQRHRDLVENEGSDAKPTLLSKLYKARDDESMTPEEVRDNAQAYIVAGSDTTSNTLTYLVWSVCRHPDVKEKLTRELSRLPDDFTVDDLKGVSYLEHVIDEALRLYPAVPAGLPRVVPPEGAQLAGYHIPGGYTVLTQSSSLHQNPEAFPSPRKFDPSRWENPTSLMKDSFMPFGGGSRICIGLHLARVELRLATARFFRAFPNARVSTVEGMSNADMVPEEYFLIAPSGHRCLIQLF
ncbi:putative cytochrome P450 [Biscogniauxia marginata]|nr:putative cytochrome P450 [Biscogniauxia marginata]